MAEECIRPGAGDDERHDRARRIGWLDMDAVQRARVLMVGAGAIGNEVGKNLVLAGFRDITVVDMDRVVISNLARCLFFSDEDAEVGGAKADIVAGGMASLDPEARVRAVVGTIQEQGDNFIGGFDLVLGCLDNLLARLHISAQCMHHGVPYIDGAMDGLRGKVQVVIPGDGACLECGMNASHARVVEKRFSCTGNDVSVYVPRVAADITTTSIVAGIMVRESLKLVSGREDALIRNVAYYDGLRNSLDVLEIPVGENCPHHR